MPSKLQSSNELLEPVSGRGYSSEVKKDSTQPSKMGKEKIPVPHANRSLKFQDKLKVENFISEKYVDSHNASRQNVNKRLLIPQKPSDNRQKQWVKSKAMKDEELVKHMSNVPGYLQRMDRGDNVQEKALNFGVLNWENLEKWKYNQKPLPARSSINSSSTSSSSSSFTGSSSISDSVKSDTVAHQRKQRNSSCNLDLSQGVKPSREKTICNMDSETAPNRTSDGQEQISPAVKSFGRNLSEIVQGKAKSKDLDENITTGMETSLLNLRNCGVSMSPKAKTSYRVCETVKRMEESQGSDIRSKFIAHGNTSERRPSSANLPNYGASLCSKEEKSAWAGQTVSTEEKPHESDIGINHKFSSGEHDNIVPLSSRHVPQNNYLGVSQLSTPRTSFDSKYSESKWNCFSDGFSPQMVHSADLYSEIPHSCPLLFTVETNTESDMKRHSNAQYTDLSSDPSHSFPLLKEMPLTPSEGKYAIGNKSNIKPSNSSVIDSSKRVDRVITEFSDKKVRNPSPNCRFSIGLGRMSRSLSFKEGSAVPQLSSTYISVKSGPVSSDASACLDNSSRDKAHSTNRARSSPLRRLLDPLLKPKAPNQHCSSVTVQPLKMNLNSISSMPESLQNEKHKASTVHALLQFTVKNGLPMFKFVVENNSSILAATLTKSGTSAKDDSSQSYTLYSVNEVKKKSGGWMNQGSKEKSCGYVYSIAGQMKVSTSHSHNLTGDKSDQFTVRESVLFGVDVRQTDQESPKVVVPNRELAAIVVKISNGELNHDGELSNGVEESLQKGFTEYLPEDRCSSNLGEDKNPCSSTVILPGGIHGLPIRGAPSPLLDRWRSGGSCDCGGWDLGCRICVLSTQDGCCTFSQESKSCPVPDRFELFFQGGAQEKKPYFSLAPFKNNIYSVEFKASISLLQALFICVAVKSGKKLPPDMFEMSHPPEARILQVPTLAQREVPAKYVPYPPLSPAGRV